MANFALINAFSNCHLLQVSSFVVFVFILAKENCHCKLFIILQEGNLQLKYSVDTRNFHDPNLRTISSILKS